MPGSRAHLTTPDSSRIVPPRWRRTFRRSNAGREPSCWRGRRPRGSQRLDRLHGRHWSGSRAARSMVRRLGDCKRRRDPQSSSFRSVPFPFLTMTVSLEAIFLALFVLASQNRLARQADKRSHLDLQIDLLAEREMTAVLQDIARHFEVQTNTTPEQLRDLIKKTDLGHLTDRMEELAEPATAAALPKAGASGSNAATS
jgi:hypothetical protein